MGGRDVFNSVDLAFVRTCSCKGVKDGAVDTGEVFGTDLDGMCPLGGLVGGNGGNTALGLGGDKGGCALDGIGGTGCVERGIGRGGWGFGDTARFDLGGDWGWGIGSVALCRGGRDEKPADPVEPDLASRVTVADRDRGAGCSFLSVSSVTGISI